MEPSLAAAAAAAGTGGDAACVAAAAGAARVGSATGMPAGSVASLLASVGDRSSSLACGCGCLLRRPGPAGASALPGGLRVGGWNSSRGRLALRLRRCPSPPPSARAGLPLSLSRGRGLLPLLRGARDGLPCRLRLALPPLPRRSRACSWLPLRWRRGGLALRGRRCSLPLPCLLSKVSKPGGGRKSAAGGGPMWPRTGGLSGGGRSPKPKPPAAGRPAGGARWRHSTFLAPAHARAAGSTHSRRPTQPGATLQAVTQQAALAAAWQAAPATPNQFGAAALTPAAARGPSKVPWRPAVEPDTLVAPSAVAKPPPASSAAHGRRQPAKAAAVELRRVRWRRPEAIAPAVAVSLLPKPPPLAARVRRLPGILAATAPVQPAARLAPQAATSLRRGAAPGALTLQQKATERRAGVDGW